MAFINDRGYNHLTPLRSGVLLVNLGTPAAPTPAAVRRYLRQFLSDPRVVELPRPLWWMILNFVVLPFRPRKSARAYAKIWTAEGSPLLLHTRSLTEALAERLRKNRPEIVVSCAMRYGAPGIAGVLGQMREQNVRRLLVLPLFPQYSGTTAGAVFDAVTGVLGKQRWLPELCFISSYHDDPAYIEACAARINSFYQKKERGKKLIFSFHGLPRRNLLNGDPYHCQCHKTARLIAAALKLPEEDWQVCFQSRFGAAEWLKPYTDQTLTGLAGQSGSTVDVFCPGFAVDCLETLEEIAMQNRDAFAAAGGGEFSYIPALNDSPAHVEALGAIVEARLQERDNVPGSRDAGERRKQAAMAKAMGAPQ